MGKQGKTYKNTGKQGELEENIEKTEKRGESRKIIEKHEKTGQNLEKHGKKGRIKEKHILAIIPATRYTCVFLSRILAFYSQVYDYFLTNAHIYAHKKVHIYALQTSMWYMGLQKVVV